METPEHLLGLALAHLPKGLRKNETSIREFFVHLLVQYTITAVDTSLQWVGDWQTICTDAVAVDNILNHLPVSVHALSIAAKRKRGEEVDEDVLPLAKQSKLDVLHQHMVDTHGTHIPSSTRMFALVENLVNDLRKSKLDELAGDGSVGLEVFQARVPFMTLTCALHMVQNRHLMVHHTLQSVLTTFPDIPLGALLLLYAHNYMNFQQAYSEFSFLEFARVVWGTLQPNNLFLHSEAALAVLFSILPYLETDTTTPELAAAVVAFFLPAMKATDDTRAATSSDFGSFAAAHIDPIGGRRAAAFSSRAVETRVTMETVWRLITSPADSGFHIPGDMQYCIGACDDVILDSDASIEYGKRTHSLSAEQVMGQAHFVIAMAMFVRVYSGPVYGRILVLLADRMHQLYTYAVITNTVDKNTEDTLNACLAALDVILLLHTNTGALTHGQYVLLQTNNWLAQVLCEEQHGILAKASLDGLTRLHNVTRPTLSSQLERTVSVLVEMHTNADAAGLQASMVTDQISKAVLIARAEHVMATLLRKAQGGGSESGSESVAMVPPPDSAIVAVTKDVQSEHARENGVTSMYAAVGTIDVFELPDLILQWLEPDDPTRQHYTLLASQTLGQLPGTSDATLALFPTQLSQETAVVLHVARSVPSLLAHLVGTYVAPQLNAVAQKGVEHMCTSRITALHKDVATKIVHLHGYNSAQHVGAAQRSWRLDSNGIRNVVRDTSVCKLLCKDIIRNTLDTVPLSTHDIQMERIMVNVATAAILGHLTRTLTVAAPEEPPMQVAPTSSSVVEDLSNLILESTVELPPPHTNFLLLVELNGPSYRPFGDVRFVYAANGDGSTISNEANVFGLAINLDPTLNESQLSASILRAREILLDKMSQALVQSNTFSMHIVCVQSPYDSAYEVQHPNLRPMLENPQYPNQTLAFAFSSWTYNVTSRHVNAAQETVLFALDVARQDTRLDVHSVFDQVVRAMGAINGSDPCYLDVAARILLAVAKASSAPLAAVDANPVAVYGTANTTHDWDASNLGADVRVVVLVDLSLDDMERAVDHVKYKPNYWVIAACSEMYPYTDTESPAEAADVIGLLTAPAGAAQRLSQMIRDVPDRVRMCFDEDNVVAALVQLNI